MKKLILVRHAAYSGGGQDPILSDYGRKQAKALGLTASSALKRADVVIWTSSAARALQTAELVKAQFPMAELVVKPQLWSDNWHRHDFNWLKNEIDNYDWSRDLIIVSHLEFVRDYPAFIGFQRNYSDYAEGVIVENDVCNLFNQ